MRFDVRCVCLALAAALAPSAADATTSDIVSEMYSWWNKAIYSEAELTPEAFGKYYTNDIVLKLNGTVVDHDIDNMSNRFISISRRGGNVENIMPPIMTFQSGNNIFTQHLIYVQRNGKETCLLASGYAKLKDGKIALVDLVRTEVTEASGEIYTRCLKSHK